MIWLLHLHSGLLLLLVAVLSQTLLAFVGRHLVFFSFLTTWHKKFFFARL